MGKAGNDLYVIQSDVTGVIKVGRTGNVERRLHQLQTGSPYKLRVILHLPGGAHRELPIHRRLEGFGLKIKAKGEWFHYDALIHLPDDLYEQFDLDVIDSWWRRK